MTKELQMPRVQSQLRTRLAVIGTSLVVMTGAFAVAPAAADDADAIYLGTRKGTVSMGGHLKWEYSDKQYRSLMMRNTRNHYFRVTYKGCQSWRVRIAVAHPQGGYSEAEDTVEGCNKTAVVTNIGKLNANVTLGITLLVSGDTQSVSVKPIN
ncbi:hypothetical protein [Streptomyces sp. NPDC059010]|uniref:hypothetical protein n=1 Tax=Streptomyces sp. NPDC059010 TaxID=3346695 RepID=UPI003684013C